MIGRVVGVVVAVLALAACSSPGTWSGASEPPAGASAVPSDVASSGGPSGGPSGGASSGAPPSSPAAAPSGSSSAGTPSGSSAGAPGGRPSAADVAACRDGRCEIRVGGTVVVPLGPDLGLTSLRITFVPPDRTLLAGTDGQGGTFRGEIGGYGEVGANNLTIRAVAVTPTAVTLRLAPR